MITRILVSLIGVGLAIFYAMGCYLEWWYDLEVASILEKWIDWISELVTFDGEIEQYVGVVIAISITAGLPGFLPGLSWRFQLRWGAAACYIANCAGWVIPFLLWPPGPPWPFSLVITFGCPLVATTAFAAGWALQYGLIVLWCRHKGMVPPKAEF